MRYVLFVKGDGRGHLTQTLSLCQLLLERGHEVAAVIVGCPKDALVPQFFFDRCPAPIIRVDSPNLQLNSKGDKIDLLKTALVGLSELPLYQKTNKVVHGILAQYRPNVIVNLFEPALITYAMFNKLAAPIINMSHQQMMLHPQFDFPKGRALERWVVKQYVRFVTGKPAKNLGLSFYDFPDAPGAPGGMLISVAPLLRREVFAKKPTSGEHFVMYMVYHGIGEQIKVFNQQRPAREIHAFWNNKQAPTEQQISPTLTFHQVSDTLFLDKLASCAGVATTAGFETVCEALYYGKPAILLPMPGQYEQFINAHDAEKVGAGKRVAALDPALLEAFIPQYKPQQASFKQWIDAGRSKMVYHLENPTAGIPSSVQLDAYFAARPLLPLVPQPETNAVAG